MHKRAIFTIVAERWQRKRYTLTSRNDKKKNSSMKIAKFQAENDLIEAKRQKMKVFGFSIFLEQITDVNFL